MQGADEPSRQLVLQRVRNRIIEYLEVASSYDRQREYQAAAPVCVASEMIEQWADWVSDPADPAWAPPVFSEAERAAISRFHAVWNQVADDTPNPLPPLPETQRLPAWERLRCAAESALSVFHQRGRLPEAREI